MPQRRAIYKSLLIGVKFPQSASISDWDQENINVLHASGKTGWIEPATAYAEQYYELGPDEPTNEDASDMCTKLSFGWNVSALSFIHLRLTLATP